MSSLFISKYRPDTLDDIVGNPEIISYFKKMVSKKDISNMIFYGDNGNGKTITAECIIKHITTDYIILNAYEDRNQNIFKNKIQLLLKKKTNGKKIIMIDEIDSLIESTQSILSKYMEMDEIRFILTCNRLDNIIDPVVNKSIIYQFGHLTDDEIYNYLEMICKKENILYDSLGLDALVFSCNGDIRIAINNLNISYYGYKQITNTNVFKICNIPEYSLLQILVDSLLQKNLPKVIILSNRFIKMGYNQIDIVTYLFTIVSKYNIDEKIRIDFLSKINKSLYILSSVSSNLQLYNMYLSLIN